MWHISPLLSSNVDGRRIVSPPNRVALSVINILHQQSNDSVGFGDAVTYVADDAWPAKARWIGQ
jgi:hypothetical protein